jgi:hypothetical protein
MFYFETAVFLFLKRDNGEHDRELQNTHNQGRARYVLIWIVKVCSVLFFVLNKKYVILEDKINKNFP